MKGDSSIRTADVCIHRQWRPCGLLKCTHSLVVVVLSLHLLIFMSRVVEAEEGLGSNPNLRQRFLQHGESDYSAVNDGTRFETAGGSGYFNVEKPVKPYLNYLAARFKGIGEKQINLQSANDEPPSALRTGPAVINTVRSKKGFNAIKSLMGLQSRSLSRSISMARSMSTEDFVEPAIQTRRTLTRQFRPRLRWG
ncbi:unnamed protein product [Allacma fusca]|uniref:Uncharacterized protein n=1 Tax=Allacma fusca TaxID=39272 RepID=A0A8J2K226_9HEXA|nr:unnamed protein product [Allacma fusca]